MTPKLAEWVSNHMPITKIMPSDGGKGDTVPFAVERRYDFPEFGVIWEISVCTAGRNSRSRIQYVSLKVGSGRGS